jgi:hypothetical protein
MNNQIETCKHKINWGVNGYGQRFYICGKCGKEFGYLSYDQYLILAGFGKYILMIGE